jgi:four helix bundle protein
MSYRNLRVWQAAVRFVLQIYPATRTFPAEERFGLTSQLRRAAISIPSNIAEGHGRLSSGEWLQFLGIARGSAYEIETQLVVARELGYIDDHTHHELTATISAVARGLIRLIAATQRRRKPNRQLTTDNR